MSPVKSTFGGQARPSQYHTHALKKMVNRDAPAAIGCFLQGVFQKQSGEKPEGGGFRQRKTPVLRTGRRNGASTISPGYSDKRFFEIYLKYLKLS
jgi:hypothetical protein